MKTIFCSKCKKNPAVIFISRIEGDKTIPEGLCIKCAMDMNLGPVKQMMDNMGVTEDDVDAITNQFNSIMGYENDENEDFEAGGTPTMPSFQGLFNALETEGQDADDSDFFEIEEIQEDKSVKSKTKKNKKKSKGKHKRKYLSIYCTDLTEKARSGKIDAIIGREKEIYRVTQILCRRSKNNPCLIGEPGVGKTAIAEGLALKIANNDVPAKLSNKEIHLLDLTALIAGTQFRGQFESRIKGLVDEVKAEGNIILFIDEVHNLVGTGDAEGSMNAANILKPALSRGEIQVIGATTFNEYRKHIEKDAALERRFQPVKVEEPSIEDTYNMLIGIKSYYENYHRVEITDNLVHRAVVLSERYINDRFLPDKAIDLLDESCTCANLRNKAISEHEIGERKLAEDKELLEELMAETEEVDYEEIARLKAEILTLEQTVSGLTDKLKDNNVTEDDLAKVIELWTGIPASKIIDSDLRKLSKLEDNLNEKLMGQMEAVSLVSAAVRRSRVQINPHRKPASFIFVGPTGVGKTELVKQLSFELFDTPETLIRLDMSEFMEKHSVSRIIGSPPGYVGYDEAGQLTEKVRRKPYSVILFDEIEKAHPDVMNILLQILDEGKITDAQGRIVSFENTVIIMTSNAGSERKDGTMGFGKTGEQASKEKAMKALREFLRPEFIGRVDEIVIFNDLSDNDYEDIAILMLNELKDPLKDKGIILEFDSDVPSEVRKKMDSGVRGARDLRNVIRREVEDKIANLIIDNFDNSLLSIRVAVDEDKISVKGS